MGFNKAQTEAITQKEGPIMVLAGPGSGKTLVITRRIQYLIQKHQVRPEEILVVTFTKSRHRRNAGAVFASDGWKTSAGDFWNLPWNLLWNFEVGLSIEQRSYSFRGRKEWVDQGGSRSG